MKLRRPQRLAAGPKEGMLERKTSKRQRLVQFFRSRKRKPSEQREEVHGPKNDIAATIASPTSAPRQSTVAPEKALEPANPTEKLAAANEHQSQLPTPPPEPIEKEKVELLSEAQLQLLFAGAPHFSVVLEGRRSVPTVTYPYGNATAAKGLSDSISFDEPAFRAATLHSFTAKKHDDDTKKSYSGYNPGIVELPSMLSAQGTEPGSIGFSYFLELPKADSLVTDLDDSQSSKHFLQASRNKELMQSSPERVGIRAVDMSLVYDRLIEVQDLYETFHDSPEPMTILNNQSAGELYANLFSKFLTPPGHDGSEDDPTGLRIQISTLCRILSLRGIWYDFSLVEWRIRLGQLIWSDPEPVPEHESHPLWTEREILLLQITLACELLLRLDAVSIIDAQQLQEPLDIKPVDIQEFFNRKTAKLDWDLILARRFLDNILAIKNDDQDPGSQVAKSRTLLSIIGMGQSTEALKSDIILLPQHQSCQLKGLLKFAEAVQWPNADVLLQDLLGKLGAGETQSPLDQPPSPSGLVFDPVTPSSISVYGTPLQTPRPTSHLLDGYFGHVGKPTLSRDNSRSLRIPLSSTLSSLPDQSPLAMMSVGGWLSRSYLTGLVLPGEPIFHFLISTLLENDTAAIARLGDSANLYGGFSYAGRTWWSKNSIVGRVFACVEGAVECMGWISFPKIPAGLEDSWHSIHSDQLPLEDRLTRSAKEDVVAQDAASIPTHITDGVKPEDLVLPSDAELPPSSSTAFIQWDLTPLNPDLMDSDDFSDPPNETDIHIPSVTFLSGPNSHVLTLAYDVQFISSWPCTSPNASPASTLPHLLKRSTPATVSRASSKRSASIRITRRNSHGFEPLLSHPPDSTDIAPKPMPPIEADEELDLSAKPAQPVHGHPLHSSYKYKIVPATHVLRPDFHHPNDSHARQHAALSSPQTSEQQDSKSPVDASDVVLVLDSRASTDLQLLARAWCAEKGYHAVIGRTSRTCLACCIREARGLGIHVIIRT